MEKEIRNYILNNMKRFFEFCDFYEIDVNNYSSAVIFYRDEH